MRGWLKKLVDQYLPAVEGLSHSLEDRATAQEWASWMRQQWEAHGLKALKQQRNLMTEVRGAIKHRLEEEHVALKTMDFSREEWMEINRSITQKAALQNENQVVLDPGTVNAIATRATNLLMSREWSEIAAGLVVLTGRRSTEVLKTAVFELKSEFSVMFTGALKRKGEEKVLTFEIPTLCQAEYVMTAWSKLRKILPASELTNTQVNQRYADEVSKACDRCFADLVSPVEGRENLYSHLFRKVYATIATYFYCPMDVDEAEFRAEIQGHFSGYEGLSLAERRTIASDRHYRSYLIADQDGNMRKGVHLGWHGVEVIEAFRKGETPIEGMEGEGMSKQEFEPVGDEDVGTEGARSRNMGRKRRRSSLGTYADEHDRWIQVLMAVCPDCPNQVEKTSALLAWIEEHLQDGERDAESIAFSGVSEQSKGQSPSAGADIAIVADQARTLSWLTGEIESLRGRVGELERERDELKTQLGQVTQNQPEVEQLRADNESLRQERDQAVSKLETFRRLLNGNGGATTPAIAPDPVSTSTRWAAVRTPQGLPSATETSSKMVASQLKESIETESASGDDGDLDPEVLRALQALMDFNDSQENHAQKWAISFPVMKDLCKQVGVATQSKIDQVFKAKAHQIEAHHQEHGLGQRHNRVHKEQSISQFIRL